MSFSVESNDFGTQEISLEKQSTEGFCFDYWNLTRDGNGVNVFFYIGETQHEVNIKFTETDAPTHRIDVSQYQYAA